jgi:UDPglucose 6-dehydrogenase
MNIGIIGIGFVGGTTAKVFSKVHKIFPYDRYKPPYTSQENINNLARNSEVVFICVPTPMKKSGEIDYEPMHHSLRTLEKACKETKRNPKEILITIRSTAVSGTTDSFAEKYPFRFAFNPEFLREKHALEDMENTDRIILGIEEKESEEKLRQVYEPLFPKAKIIIVNRKTAEMIKYAANATLASQVMIANELYKICQALGIDYKTVKETIQLDDRIAKNMEVPGHDGDLGFGGKCFPKDLNALIYLAREHQVRPYLLEEVWRSNITVRKNQDWLDIAGATSENKNFDKK